MANLQETFRKACSLYGEGERQRAKMLFEQMLAVHPRNSGVLNMLGLIAGQSGDLRRALQFFDRAVAADASNSAAHCNRGNALGLLGQWQAALASYDRALAGNPHHAEALANRGLALEHFGDWQAAIDCYDRAIAILPGSASAHFKRGGALQKLERWAEALASYDRAIALKADSPDAHVNKGLLLQRMGRYHDALAQYDRAVALKPDYVEARANRAAVLRELCRWSEALEALDWVISRKPDHAEARTSRAMLWLLLGDFERGLPEYEWRWQQADTSSLADPRTFREPRWCGDRPIEGQTLFVHVEQGLGDILQFCRYVPVLALQGVRVILEVPKPLVVLLTSLDGVAQVVARGSGLPRFDYQCPLLSLPLACRTRLETIPAPVRYLSADAAAVSRWNERLGARHRPRIGLVWTASTQSKSVALAALLRGMPPEFQYVSLQKSVPDAERSGCPDDLEILDFAPDFNDTAALCECLDLIISVDTSIAHLGAALGTPTWILLRSSPDWRWFLDRLDSPWYPSVRLYRQPAAGDWQGVFEQVSRDLRRSYAVDGIGAEPAPRRAG